MYQSNFWAQYGEAMALSVEGNRLLGQKLGVLLRNLWHRVGATLEGMTASGHEHRHLPPV